MIGLTATTPNCHLAWRWVRESWAPGQTLLLWSYRERLITTEWPRWSKCQTVPQQPPHLPSTCSTIFPRSPQILCFSFLYGCCKKKKKKNSLPFKFMRMMLMSVSSILMTLQINWVLIEVPLSVWSFFCPAKFYGGPCQSVVSSPWRRLPSILTLKGHFPPWIQNRHACWIFFFLSYWRKTFSGVFGVQLNCCCFFGKNGRLITCSAAWLRFSNPRQLKKPCPLLPL